MEFSMLKLYKYTSCLFSIGLFLSSSAFAERYVVCEYKKSIPGMYNDIVLKIRSKEIPNQQSENDFMANLTLGVIFSGEAICKSSQASNTFTCGVICDQGSFELTLENPGVIGLKANSAILANKFTLSCGDIAASKLIGNDKIILSNPTCKTLEIK